MNISIINSLMVLLSFNSLKELPFSSIATENRHVCNSINKIMSSHIHSTNDLNKVIDVVKLEENKTNFIDCVKTLRYFVKIDRNIRYSVNPDFYCDNVYLASEYYIVFMCVDIKRNLLVDKNSGVRSKKTQQDFEIYTRGNDE